ncbi:MAG: 2-C-methyl-D-erythritol 4-phosphate cytidylyltransferase [Ignavibacteriaceae bacterium]|nr:2-C-methyl-D-erythritol 4-phosphate cytidylyltransferase [Ignavibacteria bacterium]NNJ52832.1 2-C-methyl-D-erythritol 4-phosphate cytidylyltransferase [Ignavibacteriaceae bacterium]
MKTIAIIPAGGKGKRSGFSAPKQYLKFHGKELIVYTLEVFQKNDLVDEIAVSAEPAYFKLFNKLVKDYNLSKVKSIVEGGEERQDSVYSALKSIDANDDDLIIVHDAARPLLPEEVLTNAINAGKEKGNALVCIRARDTLLKGEQTVKEYLDRKETYYVQTPQIFKYKTLIKAMKKAYEKNFIGTDESMLVKELGEEINIVEGSMFNFKVTTITDVEMFEKLIISQL